MRVRKEKLPADPYERAALLRDYFCDKDAVLKDAGEYWQIELAWASNAERYIDPRLIEGLQWWGMGLSYGDMATARFRQGRVLWALYDTWTLESWCEWLASAPRQEGGLTILHIDDHRDLGSPRLFVEPGGWRDPITGHTVDLEVPTSVTKAIESGAIGMGSFLTPFLHLHPTADVRHLCQAPKCIGTTDFRIKLGHQPDDLLDTGAVRPTIELELRSNGIGPGVYRYTDSLVSWLEGIGEGPILLHIDLDYFCNRYDGDSDALTSPKPLDPSISEIRTRISELGKAMNDAGVVDRIADIAIAFSPGFFPAELWNDVSSELLSAFGEAPCRSH
ncbi:hypothetical protein [Pseudomonas aeruginosa]|uniref:hypothetical protein n=1 Tax=Pseudomonas aeruginosa TaxID=287 RepID=UPI000F6237B4|nr:hypothetical protein [Pseudomonas aeruginosa]RRH85419.1 hypothetical protein EIM22_03710 [Pseudomonas aeruginosa]HCW1033986.1 hypothetical protein [Pseudomonas aeruginosa]HCW1045679.1 hypothetical protein [Pseudomonas aeruginosa]HDY5503637.1 hypothetical protein [Pseudomonas aeruginosa]